MNRNRASADLIRERLGSKRGADAILVITDQLAELHDLYSSLERRLHQLEIFQEFRAQLIALGEDPDLNPQLPREVDLFAAELMDEHENLYRLEFDEAGIPFRWTGPKRPFSFGIHVNRDVPMRVDLYILGMIDAERQQHLRLLVDGTFLPLSVERVARGYVASAVLPVAAKQQATELTFIVPDTIVPDPSDSRPLGVSFVQLSMRPIAQQGTIPASSPDNDVDAAFGMRGPSHPRGIDPKPDVEAARQLLAEALVPSREISFTAEQLRDGHRGFYDLEHSSDGTAFRWTGPERTFAVSTFIDRRTPLELIIQVLAVVDLDRQSPLVVEVDEVPYSMILSGVGADIQGRLIIPPRGEQGVTSLSFTVPLLLELQGTGRGEVGIAFRSLHLHAIGGDERERSPIARGQRTKERRRGRVSVC